MWTNDCLIYWILSIILTAHAAYGTEFTFDLNHSDEQCFYEVIKENVECTLEFQVTSGGQFDIDVSVLGPNQNTIYSGERKDYDEIKFNTTEPGEYKLCFSNEFSTISHKSVYISFEVGDENPLLKVAHEHYRVMTFMESTADDMHKSLDGVINGQTHYRLQESHGRRFAEDLNDRILWWSLAQTFVIVAIGVSQVLVLRNFFNEPKFNNRPMVPTREPRFGFTS